MEKRLLANENKKSPRKAFHITITEIEGMSEGTPKVGKMTNKTIIAGRGKVIRFGRKIRGVHEFTHKWILKAGSRHPFLKVLSLDFISSSDFSCGCVFSTVLAEEWMFFIQHTFLSGLLYLESADGFPALVGGSG